MSRSVSAPTTAKLGLAATEPGYLVEIAFPSGTVRHSSRETTTWNSLVWVASTVQVGGIEGSGQQAVLDYFDYNAALRTLVLSDGINDRAVNIWAFYVGALASGDPVHVFAGVGNGAKIRQGRLTIGLARSGSRTLVSPRLRIGPATGFNHLPAEGTLVPWAGRVLRLERPRS